MTTRPSAAQSRSTAYMPPSAPRVARSNGGQLRPSPNAPRPWQRMNVAMQDEAAAEDIHLEDLPMPGGKHGHVSSDPFLSDPNGYYMDGETGYGGCGDPCGCGDACEPGCGCGAGDGECCDQCCNDCFCIGPGDPESCHSVRIRVPKWQELAFFGGVQGWKNPYDQERDGGNFGFHEGFNAGFKIPYTYAGYQIGYQTTQNQLNGDENTDDEESHVQHFTTFGLFRRCDDGLQFGSAWDVGVDRRFHTKTFHQIRNEISWVDACAHEFGLSATVGIMDHEDDDNDDDQDDSNDIYWEAVDQYVLFYRFHGKKGGEGRFYAGFTDDSDGIIGSDMLIPVHDRWSVSTGFTYMIPDSPDGEDGANDEAWNIRLGLVWQWGCRARKQFDNPYRPLFNVADNGYMIIDSRGNGD
jgi:hypothetical protein